MSSDQPESSFSEHQPLTISELLDTAGPELASRGEIIQFASGELDVYNPTPPFADGQELYMAGRVESRASEFKSEQYDPECWFFTKPPGGSVWHQAENLPVYKLEDPFVTTIQGELVFAGTKVYRGLVRSRHPRPWRMQFYKGQTLSTLRPLRAGQPGPAGMKDIRLLDLANGQVGVFTRPQGKKGGIGKIGFTTVPTLDGLSRKSILRAPIINSLFDSSAGEWGGANNAYRLTGGHIGLLGHMARTYDGYHEYYAFTCVFNPDTFEIANQKIVAGYQNFPDIEGKRARLERVVFPGGLIFGADGMAELYCGIGDTNGARLTIPDPFVGLHAKV